MNEEAIMQIKKEIKEIKETVHFLGSILAMNEASEREREIFMNEVETRLNYK